MVNLKQGLGCTPVFTQPITYRFPISANITRDTGSNAVKNPNINFAGLFTIFSGRKGCGY